MCCINIVIIFRDGKHHVEADSETNEYFIYIRKCVAVELHHMAVQDLTGRSKLFKHINLDTVWVILL